MTHDAQRDLHQRTSDLYLHASIAEAAALAATTPDAWVESRLRACLSVELAKELGALSKTALVGIHRWVAGHAPLHVPALPSAESICARLADRPADERRATAMAVPVPPSRPDLHRLYDPAALANVSSRITDQEHKVQFQALARHGPTRPKPAATAVIERRIRRLLMDAPHMAEATEYVLGALAVARRARGALRLSPLLLSGPPASGKTWWARQLADALSLPLSIIVMPKVTASFVLSGSTPSWSAARPGRIVEAMAQANVASPVFVLDEIEKVSTGRYDPAPVLLDLLDRSSGQRWHDEYFGIDFDVSPAVFIATCNDPGLMDPALRSRFREIRVAAPKAYALPGIIGSSWRAHRRLHPGLRLPATLPAPAITHLAARSLDMRDLQRLFEDAIGKAARRPGRLRLLPADFGAPAAALVREVLR